MPDAAANEMLSPHFSRAEFEHSDTAIHLGLTNVMGPNEIIAARALCTAVLEPIRAHFGKPITLNSGYRSPPVNAAVGSSAGSQHVRGQAADIEMPGIDNEALAHWIKDSGLPFDQLILEAHKSGDPSSGWVHVSHRPQPVQRGEVLTMTIASHGASYQNGLVA